MTEAELAYAAGIIDGEGSIGVYRAYTVLTYRDKNPEYTAYAVRVAVVNTNLPMLLWLRERFGGNLHQRRDQPRRLPVWAMNWRSRKAVALLRAVQPFLIVKAEQARLALAFDAYRAESRSKRTPRPERRAKLIELATAMNRRRTAEGVS